nr:MAG TPA_asm: hypothetical protein [Caudoviricetes sp.]
MMKTTQKAIRETCATDITNYSFDQANDLMNTHTLRTVAMSYGVYGINGALFEKAVRVARRVLYNMHN